MASHTDIARYVAGNIAHRQLRSWLTVLGIVIGIGAIVALISIAQGVTNDINRQLEQFGKDMIIISPGNLRLGAGGGPPGVRPPSVGKLFENDAKRLEKIGGVRSVSKVANGRPTVSFKEQNISAPVSGVEPSMFLDMPSLEIESGRALADGDRHVAVMGGQVAQDMFDKPVSLNSIIYIQGEKYRVVGLIKRSGNSFSGTDGATYIPYDDAKKIYAKTLLKGEITAINVRTKPGFEAKDVAAEVEFELRAAHRVDEESQDFTLITSDFINEQVGAITGLLTLFLGGIASISLVVGGVGVANTMFMAVMERTREIGVLKAVGATSADILEIFMVEAGIIGLVGGTIGTLFGAAIAFVVTLFGVSASVTWELALFALSFSVGVGIVSGYVPAKNASKLPAVEALRYE
jgi:putative ABC transport system permease protein